MLGKNLTNATKGGADLTGSAASFWQPKTIDELAAEQGVIAPSGALETDLFDNDEDIDEFLREIYESRR